VQLVTVKTARDILRRFKEEDKVRSEFILMLMLEICRLDYTTVVFINFIFSMFSMFSLIIVSQYHLMSPCYITLLHASDRQSIAMIQLQVNMLLQEAIAERQLALLEGAVRTARGMKPPLTGDFIS
jgi:hypothetical protein